MIRNGDRVDKLSEPIMQLWEILIQFYGAVIDVSNEFQRSRSRENFSSISFKILLVGIREIFANEYS